MYHFKSATAGVQAIGAVRSISSLYCDNLKRSCVVQTVKDEAIQKCQTGGRFSINKNCDVAPGAEGVTDEDKGHFSPCDVADLPVCGEGDGWFEENKSYAIGGILGLLLVGGIGYAIFKNRKKGKR